MNSNEKVVYTMVQELRYRLDSKKFEELLMSTFEDNIVRYENVSIKRGVVEPLS